MNFNQTRLSTNHEFQPIMNFNQPRLSTKFLYILSPIIMESWKIIWKMNPETIGIILAGHPISTSMPRWWFQIFVIFTPYLGKWSNLTNLFQMGWNHQLVVHFQTTHFKWDSVAHSQAMPSWSLVHAWCCGSRVMQGLVELHSSRCGGKVEIPNWKQRGWGWWWSVPFLMAYVYVCISP